MQNRKEFDENVKEKLIEKFGYSEFKVNWDDLAKLLELDLPKTKYHIFKLESQGFLRVIERSMRSGGYVTPNIIRILNEENIDETAPEEIVGDIRKIVKTVESDAKNLQAYKDEIIRLTNENRIIEEKYSKLYKEVFALRQQLLDRT
jgi:DNA polymerase elongation subunit (family B)